jgi:hypothetical protein
MALQDWLQQLCETETPDDSIIAFYFGISEYAGGGYGIYLTGSERFDADDEDWATEDDYHPEERWFDLTDEEYNDLGWEAVLEKIIAELKDFSASEAFKASFFARAEAVATGFAGGDLIIINR